MYWASYVAIMIIIGSLVYTYFKRTYICLNIALANFFIFILCMFTSPDWGWPILSNVSLELGFNPIYLAHGQFIYLYTIITSMYIHLSLWHILFNMLALIMIGTMLEERIGTLRFSITYFLTGVIAVIAFALMNLNTPALLIGASGAVCGILGAFARLYPREKIMMFLMFIPTPPMPAYILILLLIGMETLLAMSHSGNIAHIAHLGGFLSGIFLSPYIMKIEGKKMIKRKINYQNLEKLATDYELKNMLDRAKMEEEEDVKKVWLGHFLSRVKCPNCGEKLITSGRKIKCRCGFKLRY